MGNYVETLLRRDGPCLSSTLAEKLASEYKLSHDAARKRVSRGCASLKRLAYLIFPKRVRFLYLEQDFGSPYYWKALEDALEKSNSCYGLAYFSIKARDGIIPETHFTSACGSPIKQQNHIAAKTVMDNMMLAKLIEKKDIRGIGSCLVLSKLCRDNSEYLFNVGVAHLYARNLVEDSILLPYIKKWLQHNGLASYGKVSLRENGVFPKVSTFEWDLTAPSYLRILSTWDEKKQTIKPGFVTCDILLKDVDERGIKPFLKKCESLASLKNNTNVLNIVLTSGYSSSALQLARSSGLIMLVTPESIFGHSVAKGIDVLIKTIAELKQNHIDAEKIDIVFKSFEGLKGVYGNIKGTLFELLCSDVIRRNIRPDNIETNKKIKADGDFAEIDIMVEIKDKSLCFIECKGYQPDSTISHEEIKKWLTVRIPRIRKWVLNDQRWNNNIKLVFELWITCNLEDESVEMVENMAKSTKKYTIKIKNKEDIWKEAKDTGNHEIKKIFSTYFIKNPLHEIEESIKPIRLENERQSRDLFIDGELFSDMDDIPF